MPFFMAILVLPLCVHVVAGASFIVDVFDALGSIGAYWVIGGISEF